MINTQTKKIKLIDFGSMTRVEPGKTCSLFYGTKKFAAPEAVQAQPYHPKCQEIWVLGTLLFVLLFKADPFQTDAEIINEDIKYRILRMADIGLVISKEATELLSGMMEKDWRKRLTAFEVLEMPWLRK